jgi:penicillin amidase
MKTALKWIFKIVLVLVILVVLAGAGAYLWARSQVKASLPRYAGEVPVTGLTAEVTVDRDALGVPTIRAENRQDLAWATGFVHAQERYFQMDLLRRNSAGELAELIGPPMLAQDRRNRVHRFRARAEGTLAALPADERALLERYAEGVNAGLGDLGAKPFEYLALRTEPAPWQAADSLLVVYSMFLDLQRGDGLEESRLGLLQETLGEAMFHFLTPSCTPLDAPLEGEGCPAPEVPPAEVFALRQPGEPAVPSREADREAPTMPEPPQVAGSNSWAVAGTRTADGAALVANDMHLGLQVPNIWYRASLVYPTPAGERRVTGVTLPGAPLVVVGSNGDLAWGFTNSQINSSDVILLEPDPANPDGAYLTPEGPREFERHQETLRIKGAPPQTLEVLDTIWGPVLRKDHKGRRLALAWVAHHPEGLNLNLMELETATTVDEGVEIATRSGVPAQNVVFGDTGGRIAWTLAGRIPQRLPGMSGRVPEVWTDGTFGWAGLVPPAEVPRILDPESGLLWSANNRLMDGAALEILGDGNYAPGPRARQIRDGLLALEKASREDMLAVQLDHRGVFYERWRNFLLEEVLTPEAIDGDPRRATARRLVEEWNGLAEPASVGYRLVRGYRLMLLQAVGDALIADARKIDKDFQYVHTFFRYETPLWEVVRQQPPHLLDPKYDDWEGQFQAVFDDLLQLLTSRGDTLEQASWGKRNRALIRHPLSRAVPQLSGWLDMPRDPLPGDSYMPRVQQPAFGASERIVVTPGQEEVSFFHMPGGQSGHPMSPHYRDGHGAWVRGEATAFLPGETAQQLRLVPSGE